MSRIGRITCMGGFFAGVLAVHAPGTHAQAYPSRPIEFVAHTSAVTGERRFARAPEVPTLKELGFNIVAATGRGFAMPAGVPKEAAAAMEAALKRVYDTPAYQEYAERNIFENKYLGGADFAQYLVARRVESEEFLRTIGMLKP